MSSGGSRGTHFHFSSTLVTALLTRQRDLESDSEANARTLRLAPTRTRFGELLPAHLLSVRPTSTLFYNILQAPCLRSRTTATRTEQGSRGSTSSADKPDSPARPATGAAKAYMVRNLPCVSRRCGTESHRSYLRDVFVHASGG